MKTVHITRGEYKALAADVFKATDGASGLVSGSAELIKADGETITMSYLAYIQTAETDGGCDPYGNPERIIEVIKASVMVMNVSCMVETGEYVQTDFDPDQMAEIFEATAFNSGV